MTSMRDAMRRLQIIYDACNPEAQIVEKGLDEFQRLRRKVHADVKDCRKALKDRERLIASVGTTTETAEASYRIRIMIKSLKEDAARMDQLVQKLEKKKGKDPELLAQRKELMDLVNSHIAEVENMEKGRFQGEADDRRRELFKGAPSTIGGRAGGGADAYDLNDTNLPPIDPETEEGLKNINERNKMIDQDMVEIGEGVAKLKNIALDMNNELSRQNEMLEDIEKNVDKAADKLDNINVKMKKALDGAMAGDKFMINCILISIVLALIVFVANFFL